MSHADELGVINVGKTALTGWALFLKRDLFSALVPAPRGYWSL